MGEIYTSVGSVAENSCEFNPSVTVQSLLLWIVGSAVSNHHKRPSMLSSRNEMPTLTSHVVPRFPCGVACSTAHGNGSIPQMSASKLWRTYR